MPTFLFLGPPGAGKGTLAKKLSARHGWPHISTGDMFRQAYASKRVLGIRAHDDYWGKGYLVPDGLTNELAFERLRQDDCSKGFILDGYPRTIAQAEALDHQLQREGKSLEEVIYFACPSEVLVKRLANRLTCHDCQSIYGLEMRPQKESVCDSCHGELYQRPDDNEEAVRIRLNEYQRKTAPLLGYYAERGLVRTLDASLSVEKAEEEMEKLLQNKSHH